MNEGKIQILITEYEYLKQEIFHHKTTQQTVLNFVIVLAAAEIAAFSQATQLLQNTNDILLIIPLPFALLSLYHSAYTIRIHQIAAYIDSVLVPKLEQAVGESDFMRRHSYKATPSIFSIFRSRVDGRLTYIALFGLKLLPQILPLSFYASTQPNWTSARLIGFLVVIVFCLASVLGQHD